MEKELKTLEKELKTSDRLLKMLEEQCELYGVAYEYLVENELRENGRIRTKIRDLNA